jgi:predicted Zn-dependent protease
VKAKPANLVYLLFFVMSFALLVASCATSPTGRSQFMAIPEEQVDQMGTQSFDEMKAKQPIERDAATNAYVKCVANAITNALPERQQWEVVVFKSDEVNAFALPGAKIGVYTGILKVTQTPAQLAAVLGHEVGHVLAQHGRERVSQQMATQGGLQFLQTVLSTRGKDYSLLMAGLGIGAQYGILLPYGRTQESEADIIGLDLMAKAGFDPQQAPQLWKNMSAGGGTQPPEILSTHPSNSTRIENLNANMSSAMQTYQSTSLRPNCRR